MGQTSQGRVQRRPARRVDRIRLVSDCMIPSISRMRKITWSNSSSVCAASSAIRSHLPLVECTAATAGNPASRAMMRSAPRPSIPISISARTGAGLASARVSTVKPAISPCCCRRSMRMRTVARLMPSRVARSDSAARPSRRSSANSLPSTSSTLHILPAVSRFLTHRLRRTPLLSIADCKDTALSEWSLSWPIQS